MVLPCQAHMLSLFGLFLLEWEYKSHLEQSQEHSTVVQDDNEKAWWSRLDMFAGSIYSNLALKSKNTVFYNNTGEIVGCPRGCRRLNLVPVLEVLDCADAFILAPLILYCTCQLDFSFLPGTASINDPCFLCRLFKLPIVLPWNSIPLCQRCASLADSLSRSVNPELPDWGPVVRRLLRCLPFRSVPMLPEESILPE